MSRQTRALARKLQGDMIMTEAELRAIPPFDELPIYSTEDPRVSTLERPSDPSAFSGEIYEAEEQDDVRRYVARGDLSPRGGIRYEGTDDSDGSEYERVRAIFWKKR